MAVPITYIILLVAHSGRYWAPPHCFGLAYLGNIGGNDSYLRQDVQTYVHPPWQVCTTRLCKIESAHRAQLDREALQKDSEEVAKQHDEE